MHTAKIILTDGVVKLLAPWDEQITPQLSAQLRSIPEYERAYQKPYWVAEAKHFGYFKRTAERWFEVTVENIEAPTNPRTFTVEYLGRCKGADETAHVKVGGAWLFTVTAEVLKEYFHKNSGGESSRFALLGVSMDATPDELKSAYRRAARTWHPDVNKEPDAAEMFQKIKQAYDELQDPNFRQKYALGLRLQADVQTLYRRTPKARKKSEYRAPVTCGIFTADIAGGLKKQMTRIYAVNDIENADGQIQVAYMRYNKRAASDKDRWTLETEWVDKL